MLKIKQLTMKHKVTVTFKVLHQNYALVNCTKLDVPRTNAMDAKNEMSKIKPKHGFCLIV